MNFFNHYYFLPRYKSVKKYLFLLVYLLLQGCTQSSLYIVNSLARLDDYTVVQDIKYGPHALNHLDIYIPSLSQQEQLTKRPVIIFFYGGCWGACSSGYKEDYLFVAQSLTSQGYVAVLADYRQYPEVGFSEIIEDARLATEWVKENIDNYAGNSNSLFLMGHSAGAHIAAILTLDESYLSEKTQKATKGFIGLSGPYDFLPFTEPYQRTVFAPEEKYRQSQPINYVDGSEAPLLLLYGNDDETVKPRNIINLAKKVQQKGGRVKTHYYKKVDHVDILASLSIPLRDSNPVMADIINFITHHHVSGKF